ncbi:spermidine synthase [Massilia sp. W12]|uniref:spermine/spermidine synthase domain-containing protein n=1 Tax=Massilia sp. W12 TaxID=3126507 RepID=UPI0030CC1645
MLIKRKSIEKEESLRKSAPRTRRPHYAPVTLSEHDGVRYLHFGTEWVQGGMRIRKPNWLELEYAQQMMAFMLFLPQAQHVAQLGLGCASLTKFCYHYLPQTRVTAVELNPSVIAVCSAMFKLPPNDERLQVLEMDAMDFVQDSERHASLDALQVDLYDARANGPVLDSVEFYRGCADLLQEHGVMTVNLFGDHPSFQKNIKAMQAAFIQVLTLPPAPDGNVVALAFKRRIKPDFAALHEEAARIKEATKLPARAWVNGIKQALEEAAKR